MAHEHKRCQVCGRLFVSGSKWICRPCQRAKAQAKPRRWQRRQRLKCDCGKPAVTVLEVRVGLDGVYRVRLPLCADCYREEQRCVRGALLDPPSLPD